MQEGTTKRTKKNEEVLTSQPADAEVQEGIPQETQEQGGQEGTRDTTPTETVQPAVESDTLSDEQEGSVAEQYVRLAYDLDQVVFDWSDKVAHPIKTAKQGLRKAIDEAFEDPKGQVSTDELWVKMFLLGFGVLSSNVRQRDIETIQRYVAAKEKVDEEVESRLVALQEKMGSDTVDPDAVEGALEMIAHFEHQLLHEEVRLRESMKNDTRSVEKVLEWWKWLGDKNLASWWFSEEKGGKPKNTLGGKIGYAALRAASLRTLLLGFLVPVAGFAAGGTGVAAAFTLRRGISTLTGSSAGAHAGHAFTKAFLEKSLKGRIDAVVSQKTFEQEDYEQIITLKKEYDAFIQQYHPDTAEEMRSGAEYENIQNAYLEAIKFFCADAKDVENLRMKQNLGEARARNTVRKNKILLFGAGAGGALVGGAFSAFAMPKLFDWGRDLVGKIFPDSHPLDLKNMSQKLRNLYGGVAPSYGAESVPQDALVDSQDTVSGDAEGPTSKEDVEKKRTEPAGKDTQTVDLSDITSEDGEKVVPSEVVLDAGAKERSFSLQDTPDAASPERVQQDSSANDGPESANTTADVDSSGVEQSPVEDSADFVVENGFYTVREGDSLSKIWLEKVQRDGGSMTSGELAAMMEELGNLDDATLRDFGIRSGTIDLIYPDDKINIDAIQTHLDSSEVPAATEKSADTSSDWRDRQSELDERFSKRSVPSPDSGVPDADTANASADALDNEVEAAEVPITLTPEARQAVLENLSKNIPSEINLNEMTVDEMLGAHAVPEHLVTIAVAGSDSEPLPYTVLQKYNPAVLEKTFPLGSSGDIEVAMEKGVVMHLDVGEVKDGYTTSIRKDDLDTGDLERHLQKPRKNKEYLLQELHTLVQAWSIDMLPGDNADGFQAAKELLVSDLAKKDFAGLKQLLSTYEMLYDGNRDSLRFAYSHDGDVTSLSVDGVFRGDTIAVADVSFREVPATTEKSADTYSDWKNRQPELDERFSKRSVPSPDSGMRGDDTVDGEK